MLLRVACLTALLAFALRGHAADDGTPLVAAGAPLEKIAGGFGHAEGPAWMPEGFLLFADTTANRLLRFDEPGGVAVFRAPCGRITGLCLDPQGRLVAAESHGEDAGRRVSRREADGKWATLADRFEGRRFNSPNDLTIDARGRIFFTDPRYSKRETMELSHESIYRLDPDGRLARLPTALRRPNGILLTADDRTLIVADNASSDGVATLWAFDVAPDGALGQARVLFDFGAGRGTDGMALDVDGHIWAAAGTGEKAGIYVFELEAPRAGARKIGFIPVPDEPTNCAFGGPERATLFITTNTALFRIRTATRGKPTPPGK